MIIWREVRSWLTQTTGRRRGVSIVSRVQPSAAPHPGTVPLQSWASMLGSPWVDVSILGDHVIVCEDGDLIAAGSILALPSPAPEPR